MGAIQFNGTSHYLERTASVPVTAHPITIGAWFKSTTEVEGTLACVVQAGAATRRIGVRARTVDGANNYVASYSRDDFGNNDGSVDNFGENAKNTWRSAVATHGAGRDNRIAYADGTAGGTPDTGALNSNWLSFAAALSVGRNGGDVPGEYFGGYLAYLFIWDMELSESDVASWHAGTIVQEANLIAAYDFTVAPVSGEYADQIGSFDLTVNGATFDSGETYTGQTYSFGGSAPANTVAPAVTGNPWRTQTLTTDDGTWTGSPAPTYTYQWERDNSGGGTFGDITGETNDTYVLDSADVGCQVRCVVTATNSEGNDTANSNAVTVGDLYTGPPAGTGRVEVCGNSVVSYTTGSAEPPVNTAAPAVTGNKWRTQTLTTDDGTWDGSPAPTITYQWQRDNSGGGTFANIGGATANTRVLDASDVGCQLRCVVTGTNSEGSDTANSNAVTVGDLYTGPPAGTGRVEVMGTAVVDYDIPLAPGAGLGDGNLSSPSMSGIRF